MIGPLHKKVNKLLSFLLVQEWIDQSIKCRNQNENKGRVKELHLIGFNNPTTNLTIHSGSLESPTRTLKSSKYTVRSINDGLGVRY